MAKNAASTGMEPASLKVAKAELARKILRDASEEVRAAFPRDGAGTELVLIDVDPHRLHAFWTVPVALMEEARALPGGGGAAMVLRVFPLADGDAGTAAASFFDVDVGGLKGRTYIDVSHPERRYRASLGLRGADGAFTGFASSNEIALPPAGPAPAPAPPAEPPQVAEPAPGEDAAAGDDPFPHLFDLEAVLPVSSYILAGEKVAFEATAELHIHGHAQPGSTVRLFGRDVPVRPDGSFSVTHVLPSHSPLLASILAAAAAEPAGSGAAAPSAEVGPPEAAA